MNRISAALKAFHALVNVSILSVSILGGKAHALEKGPEKVELDQVHRPDFYLRQERPDYRNFVTMPFVNYPYEAPPYDDVPRTYYGPLGNRLIHGYDFYTWRELRMPGLSCEGRRGQVCGSNLNIYGGGSGSHVVGTDGYNDWGYSFSAGTAGSTRFTPLTVSRSGPDGTRFDLYTPYLKTSTLFSQQWQNAGKGQLMWLNRAQFEFGAVTWGLNFTNWHHYDSTVLGNSMKGRLVTDDHGYGQHSWNYNQLDPVSWIFIRFSDDSPDDRVGGPIVHEVELLVNGEHRPDLRPLVIRHRVGESTSVGRISQATGEFRPIPYATGRTGSLHADYFSRIDHEQGIDVSDKVHVESLVRKFLLENPDRALYAGADEGLVFLFDLSNEPTVRQVEVEAVVGNDYRIEESMVKEVSPRAKDYMSRFNADSFETLVRARGNVRDGSNLKRIRFKVGGMWTGQFVYGTDLNIDLPYLQINAEYARTTIYRRYPAKIDGEPAYNRSPRQRGGDAAYFINATHWFNGGLVAGEYYAMNPEFVNDTIDDNDDGDILPDMYERPWNGVYVGQDRDNDGLPDVNRDGDALPDYVEPLLMYEVEPNEFVYGLDRNNNDEPDYREDDVERDYPYDPDQRGYHFFGQLDLSRYWSLSAGHYLSKQIAGDGRNQTTYTLLTYQRQGVRRLRQLFFESGVRRVKDDIRDDYMVFMEDRAFRGLRPRLDVNTFLSQLREDPLEYIDSYVNETNLEFWVRPWSTLNVVQKTRVRLNWQQGQRLSAAGRGGDSILDYRTWVSRVDYTWHWGRLSLQPKFKFMLLRVADRRRNQAMRYELDYNPIVEVRYQLMNRTLLRLGIQGWGPIPYRFENRTRPSQNFERRSVLGSITNRSMYLGYELYTIVGFEKDAVKFDAQERRIDDNDGFIFFIRALIGFTEFGPLL